VSDAFEQESDAYLVGMIVNGDAEAVRPLIDRYRKPLGALLQRALGASPDVDDVFQETWIRVVRSARRYDPAQRFSAWLFAIAWNLVKDRWSRQVPHDDVALEELHAPELSAEERALASEASERLRAFVAQLPERMAEAILLRYFDELSEKQMAERLGIPVGTVKSRLHHGLSRLRKDAYELQ
jgi:RNA polymerase sigma-70 factor, ECF subfamily